MYPLTITLVHNGRPNDTITHAFSRRTTVADMKRYGCSRFKVAEAKVTLFSYHVEVKGSALAKEDMTLEEARVTDNTNVLFEEEGVATVKKALVSSTTSRAAGSALFQPKYSSSSYSSASNNRSSYSPSKPSTYTSSYGSSSSSSMYGSSYSSSSGFGTSSFSSYGSSSYGSSRKPEGKGLTGLSNLGNTCFMNSALQCLSNAVVLRDFFLQDDYVADINRDNPIGMKGQIAEQFAALMKRLWEGRDSHVSPTHFKSTLGRFAPQFTGYAQQDAQELLAYLLDGLHEDLNRVLQKPATPTIESNGRPDAVVAKEAWDTYLLRNQSVIVDHFVGQYKSKLVCPVCDKVSITFDPFMYLSVPLPEPRTRVVQVLVMPWASEVPVEYAVTMERTASVADLRVSLSEAAGVDCTGMALVQVSRSEISRVFKDSDSIEELRGRLRTTLLAAEVPEVEGTATPAKEGEQGEDEEDEDPISEPSDSPTIMLPFSIKCSSQVSSFRSYAAPVGYPFLAKMQRKTTSLRDILLVVWQRVSCLFDEEKVEEEDNEAVVERAHKLLKVKLVAGSSYYGNATALTELDEPVSFPGKVQGITVELDAQKAVPRVEQRASRKETDASVEKLVQVADGGAQRVSLNACLDEFVREEILSPTDPWYCSKCATMRQASKTMYLYALPDVLIIHLKRFKYTSYSRDKLSTVVDFPLEGLDISSYLPGQNTGVYDLFAVSNHMGGMAGGHYTAYAKNDRKKSWYLFDDSRVAPASEASLVSASAYLLFYAKRPATT